MKKVLPYLALLLSTVAIVLAGVAYARSSSRAQAIVREREQAFIRRIGPPLLKMYDDMRLKRPEGEPDTIEDLLEPLMKTLTGPMQE